MKPVVLHSAVESELTEAAQYYDEQRPGLGREFRLDFEDALSRIARRGTSFAVEVREVRRCTFQRFPYNAYFVDEPEPIRLLAVAHHHRRPRSWLRRRPNDPG